jgi:sarcosine oxidase
VGEAALREKSVDIAIAGGGVIGSAIAYFLAAEPGFQGRIAVLEPDSSYQFGSTGRSLGSIRQQFSTPENIRMSLFSAAFLSRSMDLLAVKGETPEIGFREHGYLFLADARGLPILQANHRLQASEGADNVLLDPSQLKERFAWLDTAGLEGGCLGLSMEGWLDPHGLLQAFRRKARALGVTYIDEAVSGVKMTNGHVTALRLSSGQEITCGWIVNAAGAAAAKVADMIGVELPVRPRKRSVFGFNCRAALPPIPLVIDTSGVYLRPEGQGYLCGASPRAGEPDPDSPDFEVDHALFEERIWPALARRIPAFEAIKPTGAWAGHYAYNTFDQNAILGPHPEVPNFVFANGFSGHGLQQSPAVGRAIMEVIVHGGYRTLDLSRLGFERIAAGEPVIEASVV